MSAEENKALIQRWYECWNKGDWDGLYRLQSVDFIDHNPQPGQAPGIEGLKQQLDLINTAVPGSQIRIVHLMADGDKVVDHSVLEGKHTGPSFGIPPSDKSVSVSATNIWRIQNGKIAEIWHIEDIFGLMQQIGAIPPAAKARPQMNQAGRATKGQTESGTGMPMGS